MSKYGFGDDYVEKESQAIKNFTLEDYKGSAQQYIRPDKMIYLVVGDATTQLKPLEGLGYGKPVLIN
jgi:zinc protease